MNYPAIFDPEEIVRGKRAIEWVKDECKHIIENINHKIVLIHNFT